jgi:single-strand DNA-binding protein
VSRSLNKVMLIGNLGSDPEVRSTTGGSRVATFSLATSRQWNAPNGEKQEKTEWHRCVVWNNKASTLADVVEKYCKKGDKIYVEGRIEYRQWQDKDNQTRYSTEINVRELLMLAVVRLQPLGPRRAQRIRGGLISRISRERSRKRMTTFPSDSGKDLDA